MSASKPRVFISYNWSSADYQASVKELANRLERDDVDVVIDVWDLKPGQDKYAFMERCVTDESIDKVLVLCDAQYAAKADDRSGGVCNETAIITPVIYGRSDQTKVIPVLMERDADGNACLPDYLSSRVYVDLSDPDHKQGYDALLESIRSRPSLQSLLSDDSAYRDPEGTRGLLLSYLSARGARHRDYRHYATRARIKSILDNGAIYLTDGSTWNDRFDRERFNPSFSARKRFGVCLSSSTEESAAMWMLHGGIDGNGAMINFDKGTLSKAMSQGDYEFGRFGADGEFEPQVRVDASDVHLTLTEVLYFKVSGDDKFTVMRSMGDDQQVSISRRTLAGIDETTQHASWSYEQVVRLTATVRTDLLGGHESQIRYVRVPLEIAEGFVSRCVYDSPVSDGRGTYRDSELLRTVEWDLCGGRTLMRMA